MGPPVRWFAMGYYDYQPLARLERHFLLAGYVADETRRLGFELAARTGLGVSDVDRTVEHHASTSLWEFVATDGEMAYRELESEVLARLLRGRPSSIISLGDGTLLSPENRRLATSQADLALLDRDLGQCYWKFQQRSPNRPGAWHPLHPEPLVSIDQVRSFFAIRRQSFSVIDRRVDLRGRSRRQVVEALIALLEPTSGGASAI